MINILSITFAIVLAIIINLYLLDRLLRFRWDEISRRKAEEREKEKRIPTPLYPFFSQAHVEFLHDTWKKNQDDYRRQEANTAKMIETEKKEFNEDQKNDFINKDRRFKPSDHLRSLMENQIMANYYAKKAEKEFRSALEANLAIFQGKKTILEAEQEEKTSYSLITREEMDNQKKRLNDWLQRLGMTKKELEIESKVETEAFMKRSEE